MKGYSQKEGIDFVETFAPTAKWTTICPFLSLAAQNGWKIHQMDVKTALLNGDLKETVYMTQPEGYVSNGKEHQKFGMADCKPLSTPMEKNIKLTLDDSSALVDATLYRKLVGSLIYATTTHPDIAFSVGVLSRFMQQPRQAHWSAAKRILRYLKGTQHYGLKYSRTKRVFFDWIFRFRLCR